MGSNYNKIKYYFIFGFLALLALTTVKGPAVSQPPYKRPVISVMMDGLVFPESPVLDSTGAVIFSDVHGSKIYRFTREGKSSVWFDKGIKTNGLYFSKDWKKLYACAYSEKSLIEIDAKTKKYKVLAKEYQGKPFNNVNDLTIAPNGTIYFTDPSWSGKTTDIQGIYAYSPKKALRRVAEINQQPNGIAVTPDGKWLYVDRSGAADLWRYKILPDGTLSEGTCLIQLEKGSSPDGITIDAHGNIYIAQFGNDKIAIVSPQGKLIQQVELPVHKPTNVELFKADERVLFVTCGGAEDKKEGSLLNLYFYAPETTASK
jgi:gluconolactonase